MFVLKTSHSPIANFPLSTTKVGLRAMMLAMHARMLKGRDLRHPNGQETPLRRSRVDITRPQAFRGPRLELVRPG